MRSLATGANLNGRSLLSLLITPYADRVNSKSKFLKQPPSIKSVRREGGGGVGQNAETFGPREGVKDIADVRKLVLSFIPACFADTLYG